MKKLISALIFLYLFCQFGSAGNAQNPIFRSNDKSDTIQTLLDDSLLFRFNTYDISTFNDPPRSDLPFDSLPRRKYIIRQKQTFVSVAENEYIELRAKVYVDSSMADKIIGFEFSIADFTTIFWDDDKVVSQGKLDGLNHISEPYKSGLHVYPVYTADTGFHQIVIRQIYNPNDSEDESVYESVYYYTFKFSYNIYEDYSAYIAENFKKEHSLLHIAKMGRPFFLFSIFLLSTLFYFIVQKSKFYLSFSVFSLFYLLEWYLEFKLYNPPNTKQQFADILMILPFFALVFYGIAEKIPNRVYWYLVPVLIFGLALLFDYLFPSESLALWNILPYFFMLVIISTAALFIEAIIKIVFTFKLKRKRIKIVAFGILLFMIIGIPAAFVNETLQEYIVLIKFYLFAISILFFLIYTVKDTYTENLLKQAEVLTLTQANEKILAEQTLTLEARVKQRTAELATQKERSEALLLNILPYEVAEELKNTGQFKAKTYSMVTVMFTDFKDFTSVSEKVSAELLVSELHHCFSGFDSILQKYNIEKIKTVGDAYMCASGLPSLNYTHAIDVVKAAIEMREFIRNRIKEKEEKGEIAFHLRIGIHTGPVVAGIVGVKKFSYDIWGDTVNLASRMESSGEAGKINISGSTYELVKDKFNCTYRGKIQAKNKGEIDMYFVENIT
ncbi:MAG: adenylate/guanylate cyclase domain-containing protein [Bacteroidota bacterium]